MKYVSTRRSWFSYLHVGSLCLLSPQDSLLAKVPRSSILGDDGVTSIKFRRAGTNHWCHATYPLKVIWYSRVGGACVIIGHHRNDLRTLVLETLLLDISTTAPVQLDLTNTFGAFLIGVFVSTWYKASFFAYRNLTQAISLFGINCLQVFYYYTSYSDPLLIKSTVAALWCLDAVHVIFGIYAVYGYLVVNYSNPMGLLKTSWAATLDPGLLLGILNSASQWQEESGSCHHRRSSLFADTGRIIIQSRVYLLFQLGFNAQDVSQLVGTPQNMSKVSFSVAALTDIIIAATLTYLLNKGRSGLHTRTNSLINRLIIITVNNGILTSLADITTFVLVVADDTDFIYLAMTEVLGTLYINSLLATLNTRRLIQPNSGIDPEIALATQPLTLQFAAPGGSSSRTISSGKVPDGRPTIHLGSSN
ncbi:hypothetical protein C8R43DRAFT_960260 [Mycena crocata]|nr:hypothetical protein C8R43DRAFT_960260 [Mycena crocata]